jgi:Choline/Carnitine o-acyltransferase
MKKMIKKKTIAAATLSVLTVLLLSSSATVQGFAVCVKSPPPPSSVKTTPSTSSPPTTASFQDPKSSSKTSSSSIGGTGTGVFKPWPTPLVISDGDYRNEMFLEQHIGGPLYSQQKHIPKLPLPTLEQAMETLMPTALPLAENETEVENFQQACKDFIHEAAHLQERLVQRQHGEFCDSSWLQELWQKASYLQYRESLPTYVSYYLMVGDDKTLPDQSAFFATASAAAVSDNNINQNNFIFTKGIARAAAVIVAVAETRKQICSGEMPYETIPHKDGQPEEPLCSTGFKVRVCASAWLCMFLSACIARSSE